MMMVGSEGKGKKGFKGIGEGTTFTGHQGGDAPAALAYHSHVGGFRASSKKRLEKGRGKRDQRDDAPGGSPTLVPVSRTSERNNC